MISPALFRSLGYRPFAMMWFGQTISRLGDSLYTVAIAWWVLQATGSATAMGTVLVCAYAPMVVFTLLGGVLADRLPRIRVMVLSDLLSGLVVTVVTLLAISGQLQLWHVYVASTIFGFVSAFFEPSYQAVIPDITPRDALASANSLTSLSRQLINIGGPAIGAGIVALGGTPIAFSINALSFFVSAALIAPLPEVAAAEPTQANSMLSDLRGGIAAVATRPWLWITIALFALVNVTAAAPVAVALPFLITEKLGGNVEALGLILSISSAGAVAAALLLGRQRTIRWRGPVAYGATIVAGLSIASLGVFGSFLPVAAAMFLQNAMFTVFGLIWMNTVQEMVPRELMGRVVSIDLMGSFLLLPVGFALVGWGTDQVGASMVFLLGGGLTVLMMLLGLLHPAIRKLD